MAAAITTTEAVNTAIAAAQDLPTLVANLQVVDPSAAQQITGKALIASKSLYGTPLAALIVYLAAKYGLNWDPNFCALVAGFAVLIATAIFRKLSTIPITSWFVSKKTAPNADAATPSPSILAKTASIAVAALMLNLTLGCATLSADAAIVEQKVSQNAAAISSFCASDVLPVANSPVTKAALLIADALPYGSDLTLAANSAVNACSDIATVSKSITTLPWLKSQVPVIKGAGKVAPPPVIAPAPVTATAPVPTV